MKLLEGLIAGAIAAIAASLLSLPLESPDDLVFNTATVTAGALAAGLFAGLLWNLVARRPGGLLLYAGGLLAAFGAVALLAVAGETQLSETISFVVPLAAVSLGIAGVPVPVLSLAPLTRLVRMGGSVLMLFIALGVGFGLAGVGDSESGRLELPDPTPPAAGATITPPDVDGIFYNVVPDESQLTYTVREKLASLPQSSDAVGRTGTLAGVVRLDGQSTTITADMSTLTSDQERRDDYVRTRVFNTDPTVTFSIFGFDLPDEYTPGTTLTQTVNGMASVRGIDHPLSFAVEARLDGDGTLRAVGRTDFTWADFQIDPPAVLGIVQAEDGVHIEVLIVARPAP